jgi:hypothetical protein
MAFSHVKNVNPGEPTMVPYPFISLGPTVDFSQHSSQDCGILFSPLRAEQPRARFAQSEG